MSTSSGWEKLSSDLDTAELEREIRAILRSAHKPWNDIRLAPTSPLDVMILDVLQKELDDARRDDQNYFSRCFKCLRALSKERDIFPQCFSMSDGIARDHGDPIDGGGAADIWTGKLDGKVVCLKVLRTFPMKVEEKRRLLKELCREATIWKQLKHPNILPFIGVNTTSFAERVCLISPWMKNGNIIKFLELNQDHDHERLKYIREIACAIAFLHHFDPPIVHGDIRGHNVLISDDHHCLLADFGSSLIIATQVPSMNTLTQNSTRWLSPEFQLPESETYEIESTTARDIYALGCTIIEIFTLKSPFPHIFHNSSVSNLVVKKGTSHPRPPLDVLPSDKLWELVLNCMNFDPRERPSAKDVVVCLQRM
ncbi:kinase-like domain-containing protein [Armillaria fumosa]|nr:kinase-like domain-containing protein [Armillaria fumosa]